MASYYERLDNGNIKLIVSIGSGKNRIRRSKNIPPVAGRKREQEKTIQKLLDAYELEMTAYENQSGIMPTFEKFFYQWFSIKKEMVATTTSDQYIHKSKAAIEAFGKMKMNEITVPMIQSFLINLKKEYSPRTVKDFHSFLKTLFHAAMDWEVIKKNPMDKIKAPKVPKKEMKIYNRDEAIQIIHGIESEPLDRQCILLLALFGGLRRSEIAGLNYDDIDKTSNMITISRAYVHTNSGPELKSTKSNKISRISIPDFMMSKLRTMAKESIEEEKIFQPEGIHAGALFKQISGDRIYPTTPYSMWMHFQKKNGLKHVTLHGLRHTCASLLIAGGADIPTVSRHLTHANSSITLKTYTHFVERNEDIISDTFNNIIKNAKNSGAG